MSDTPPAYDVLERVEPEDRPRRKETDMSPWVVPFAAASLGFLAGALIFRLGNYGDVAREYYEIGRDYSNLGTAATALACRRSPYRVVLSVTRDENVWATFRGKGEVIIIGDSSRPWIGRVTADSGIALNFHNVRVHDLPPLYEKS